MRFTTSELADRLGGTLIGPDVTVDGASIDSRSLVAGQLFVPIVAARDGHEFIGAAVDAGAAAYLTTEPVAEARARASASAVVVADTAAALLELGRMARDRIGDAGGGVIGITGSVGKTTTKDLLRACLAGAFPTAASERSYNNELGLPLTLLNTADDVRWVVLEMGARGIGHIAQLAEVARPDVGIVTSVAMAHVEYLGDLDGVARAKSELVAALPESGVAVLNFDDPRVAAMGSQCGCPVVGYSVAGVGEAEVRAEGVTLDEDVRPRFRLVTPWGKGDVRLSLAGAQQVSNALAAAAAALWCGVGFDEVVAALGSVEAPALRMEVRRASVPGVDGGDGDDRGGGPVLIVDCYNANPASTEAALRALAALAADRRVALLGLMAELGGATGDEHRRLSALAEELGIEVVGYETDLYGAARVDGVDAAVALLRGVGPGDAVLVKGSRVARLEDVVRAYEGDG
ncbi:MAG TPA: UDP-N-acetylmuramoyl-tripeptide--D-alanyl-D-alanine ligase [Acidimicrobiales bacterium]|nr:UDP-N-acetylmuramoyl-tripeptide--D-alanyl-D-alanine ligase [Acidimicrobiales bacterium]